ncbi:hypothetical protein KI387_014749, partial [Taxus chinensis]
MALEATIGHLMTKKAIVEIERDGLRMKWNGLVMEKDGLSTELDILSQQLVQARDS